MTLRRTWRPLLAVVWVGVVASLTLVPAPLRGTPGNVVACLVCGSRGTADALLNVGLFAPLGFLSGQRRRAILWAAGVGALIAVGIEATQFFVPGRYPTLGDVVWNGAGSAVGAAAWRLFGARATGSVHRWAASVATAVVGLGILGAGALLEPRPTEDRYWGQWTPDLSYMPQYRGTLIDARLNGRTMPRARFPADWEPLIDLRGDWRIEARVIKGPPPRSVSPIVNIYDGHQREVVLLGAHRESLVWRERMLATTLRFDQPDMRFPDALRVFAVGDTVRIAAARSGRDRCLEVEGSVSCGLKFTPGRTWSLLLYLEGPSERVRRRIDAAWLLALFFPVGFLSLSRVAVVGNGAVLIGLALGVTTVTRLAVLPGWEGVAAVAGLGLGWIVARIAARTFGSPGAGSAATEPGS